MLDEIVHAIERGDSKRALELIQENINADETSGLGIDCRNMRAMGYATGYFANESGLDIAIADYEFLISQGIELDARSSRAYASVMYEKKPSKYKETIFYYLNRWNKLDASADSHYFLGLYFEAIESNYKDAGEHYRAAFLQGDPESGRSWGRMLRLDGKLVPGVLVAASAVISRLFLRNSRRERLGFPTATSKGRPRFARWRGEPVKDADGQPTHE